MIVALDAGGELDVVLRDAADAAVHERELHLVALELAEALGERLERAGDVGLDDEVERGGLARLDLLEDVLEPGAAVTWRARRAPMVRQALPVLAGLGDACVAVFSSGATTKSSPALGDVGQAEHLDRRRRAGFLDLLALVVDERPHAAPGRHRRRAGRRP